MPERESEEAGLQKRRNSVHTSPLLRFSALLLLLPLPSCVQFIAPLLNALQRFDRQLLEKAGVKTDGRVLLQLYPQNVENVLAKLELDSAGGRSVDEIRRTIFGVRRDGSQYEFHVVDQQFRAAPG